MSENKKKEKKQPEEYTGKIQILPPKPDKKEYIGGLTSDDIPKMAELVKDMSPYMGALMKPPKAFQTISPSNMTKIVEKGSPEQRFCLVLMWLNNWYIRKISGLNLASGMFGDSKTAQELQDIKSIYERHLHNLLKDFGVKVTTDSIDKWRTLLIIQDAPFDYKEAKKELRKNRRFKLP